MKHSSNRNLGRNILFTLIALGLIWNLYRFHSLSTEGLNQPFRYKVGVECGIIESDFTERRDVKRGHTTDYFLKVRYNDRVEVMKVSAQTWHANEVGGRICFGVYKGMPFTGLIAMLTYIGAFITIVVFIILGLPD